MKLSEYLSHGASEGERNSALFQAAVQAREQGWEDARIYAELSARASADGLNDREIATTLASAMRHDLTPRPKKQPEYTPRGTLDWDSILPASSRSVIAQPPQKETPPPFPEPRDEWLQNDFADYIHALFKPGEKISYNLNVHEEDGAFKPAGRGIYNRDYESLCDAVPSEGGVGMVHPKAGAWIRLNPVDGNGIADANCTAFRHALVECDDLSLDAQWRRISELKLPCSAVVHSGGKSLHFIVRVDAANKPQFKERVDILFAILKANGIPLDEQNRNPSRLSRMPGVYRDGKPQYLLGTNMGCPSWDEWIERMTASADGLPQVKCMTDVLADPTPLPPELIHGILRCGHKLLLSSCSKGGKTWTLLHLALAISEGRDWLGHTCMQGKVLYVNLEIAETSFRERCKEVIAALGYGKPENVYVWPLRGYTATLTKIREHLVKNVRRNEYDAIIIDPIYKTLTGDENSAKDMSDFCRELDIIADKLGASVIFSSHFAKGVQGGKYAIDRTSGSGVFGRDPDAIGTLTQLEDDGGVSTGVLLEWVLREFPTPDPSRLEWKFPIHVVNNKIGGQIAGSATTSSGTKRTPQSITSAVTFLSPNALAATPDDVAKHLGISRTTLMRRIKKEANIEMQGGLVTFVGDQDGTDTADTNASPTPDPDTGQGQDEQLELGGDSLGAPESEHEDHA